MINQYDLKYTQARNFYTDLTTEAYKEILQAINEWHTTQIIETITFSLYEDGILYATVYYE